MEIGEHKVKVLSHYFEDKESGAACVVLKCQFDNGETDFGRIWVAKKGGEVTYKNIELVRKLFGWTTNDTNDLNNAKYDNLEVNVTVEMETTQNGRELPRIKWINPIRKVQDAESAKAQASRWASKFTHGATTLAVKPLSVVATPPPVQVPVAAPQVVTPQVNKPDPGAKTLEAFDTAFADRTEEHRTLLWHHLLNSIMPGVDTASATRDQWIAVYKAIPALRKQVEEQDKAVEADPGW